jgi:hypothetical protein
MMPWGNLYERISKIPLNPYCIAIADIKKPVENPKVIIFRIIYGIPNIVIESNQNTRNSLKFLPSIYMNRPE